MLTKEEAKEKVKQLVQEFKEIQKKILDEKSEDQIRVEFIDPLFEALGWDMRKEAERNEQIFKGRADYILRFNNKSILVIEAKRTSVRLDEGDSKQAVEYAHNKHISFCVLTNFKQIRIYHALSNPRNIEHNLMKDNQGNLWINFEDYENKFERLWLLSKESFEKGELNKFLSLKDIRINKPIDKSLLEDLLEIRRVLSVNLKNLRNEIPNEKRDEIIQILINRLIFIRSAEDRGLEESDLLLNIVKNHLAGKTTRRLWEILKTQFKIFNKEYDSKLFEESTLDTEGFFDEPILIKVIKGLYFGIHDDKGRYMFDAIPKDILGMIYEQYLGTILQDSEKRVKLNSKTGKRKKLGIYYTPPYIVDYIIKNSVGEYIKDKSIDEILKIKIVDPACGSGSFLVRAFEEICKRIEELMKNKQYSEIWHISFKDFKGRLSIAQKNTIFENCIFGVDLDEKAIELAELNMALKILENETRLTRRRLANLKDNLKCGNSLIDDFNIAGDKAFNWQAQFPEVFRNGGFDIVIGNPPYFKIREGDPIKNTIEFKEIKDGMMNVSAVFIYKGLKLIKDGGYLGMIVPKMLAFTDSWNKIRKKFLKETTIKKIVDAGKAFDEVLLEQIIFCLKKELEKDNNIAIGKIKEMKEIIETANINQQICINDNKLYLEPNEKAYEIKKKMETSGKKLGDITDIFLGLGIQGMKNFSEHEKKGYLKVLRGNDIQRWYIRGNKYYDPEDKDLIKYKKEMQKFYRPHIVAQRIVAHIRDHIKLTVAFDKDGLFSFNTVTNILVSDKKYSEEFIVALLNSKLIQYYTYKFIYQNAIRSMDFYEVYAKQIPISENVPEKCKKYFISWVNRIYSLQKKLFEDQLSGGEKERLETQIRNIEYEIDQEIYKLYEITEEEQRIIEDSLK